MRGLLQILVLEWRALIRTGILPLLWLFAFLWTAFAPFWLQSDGTPEGAREIFLTYGVGTVVVLTFIAFGTAAAGSLAKERSAKRLQLSLVRPVSAFALAWGRMVAYTLGCASVIAISLLIAAVVGERSRCAYHVRTPILQSPAAEAEQEYADYMRNAETPEVVKKMKKGDVLRILEQKAYERYMTIGTNTIAAWKFRTGKNVPRSRRLARFKFASIYNTRADVRGEVAFEGAKTAISNITSSVVIVPLKAASAAESAAQGVLTFQNQGKTTLMLRPRKDVHLLEEAGTFGGNLVRAGVALTALGGLIIALGIFLSAGLGRSVAVFTLLGFLFVSAVGGDVIESYPDPLETNRLDRIGLKLTRSVEYLTQPFARTLPLNALIADEYLETEDLAVVVGIDLVVVPLVFAAFSALCLRRKEEGL